MNTSRLKIFIISLLMFPLYLLLYSSFIIAATRGLQMIGDLSHQSGKLGAYRALVIGIDDYKDPKIPDLNTAIKDAQAMADSIMRLAQDPCYLSKLKMNARNTAVKFYSKNTQSNKYFELFSCSGK